MKNVEIVAGMRYDSIESMIADILPLFEKPPFNARPIEPKYIYDIYDIFKE